MLLLFHLRTLRPFDTGVQRKLDLEVGFYGCKYRHFVCNSRYSRRFEEHFLAKAFDLCGSYYRSRYRQNHFSCCESPKMAESDSISIALLLEYKK